MGVTDAGVLHRDLAGSFIGKATLPGAEDWKISTNLWVFSWINSAWIPHDDVIHLRPSWYDFKPSDTGDEDWGTSTSPGQEESGTTGISDNTFNYMKDSGCTRPEWAPSVGVCSTRSPGGERTAGTGDLVLDCADDGDLTEQRTSQGFEGGH